ncbi:MAG TPA: 2,3-diaminopropionate biosynthesis protein SbnB [Conexibacter sp.]|nr:2,3-diaminopropionate biosynthesis protein SbnB [Conexibacter sp.]
MTSTRSQSTAPRGEPAPGAMLYLSRAQVREAMGGSIKAYVEALRAALSLHAGGETAQPLKPYLKWRENGHIADRIIAMPGYVGGEAPIAGIKWIGSKHDNPATRGIERASAVIVLNDAETHYPIAVMEGGEISGMRTAGITVLATEYLARDGFETVGLIGCGFIGRLHALGLVEAFPQIRELRLCDHKPEAAQRLADELAGLGFAARVCASAEEAVRGSEVVVPCTVADTPYIPFEWLSPGTFVSNISIMDVEPEVFVRVDKLVVDDWDQCNRERKTINQLVLDGRLAREDLHAELGEIARGERPGRTDPDERIMLNPMGMAIEDVACAAAVYRRALERGIGTWLTLE